MKLLPILLAALMLATSCHRRPSSEALRRADSLAHADSTARALALQIARPVTAERIDLSKELLYDRYTLPDEYSWGSAKRYFQWDKIKAKLALIEQAQSAPARWAVLENRHNRNGIPLIVANPRENRYGNIADTLGRERYQGIPLHTPHDTILPVIYGRDGDWVRIVRRDERWTQIETLFEVGRGYYLTPSRYVRELPEDASFRRVALADRQMQHIVTLEKSGDFGGLRRRWIVRSMNPASTGAANPPYQQLTPLGIFVVQEKKQKMFYLVDGSTTHQIEGFAPFATRFSNGGYIHGVPVNDPYGQIVEYLYSLGTIPRSHMCVRNASSHARFVYDWAEVDNSLVVVIE